MMQTQLKFFAKRMTSHPEMALQMNLTMPAVMRSFSTETANKNYDRFLRKYHEHTAVFKERTAKLEKENEIGTKKPISKGFSHPYQTAHHPLNLSVVKTAEFFHDFIGPEQVSPHYENFMVARKWALIFWGGLSILCFGTATLDLHWIMKSSLLPFVFWIQIMYFYLEARKSLFKPLLARFYRRIAANEIYNFDVFYHENIELRIRELLRSTKGQLEFWQLHREYNDIKAESVNNYLANEYLNLQKHISERALNILKQAQIYEETNKNTYIQNILDEASREVDRALADPKNEALQKKMLESAIDGLSKGYMDYANDPILPLVKQIIEKNIQKFNGLSETEKGKLLSLTESQIKSLKESDQHAKHDFLTGHPKGLDSSLKNQEHVKKVLSTWGH